VSSTDDPSPTAVEGGVDETDRSDPDTLDREALEGRVELLEAENDRLRQLYARTRRTAYRRTAAGLALVGGLAVGGGLLFPLAREVLFIIGAIGLFGGLLTYYLTPERFVAADVAERVYTELAANDADLIADLGLSEERVYLPDAEASGSATLFIPQDADAPLPDPEDREGLIVVTDETRGLALRPSGAGLFRELERTLAGPLAESPATLADQVSDALVESFELVDGTERDLDAADGRLTLALRGCAYPNAFDTPPASLLGVAFAVGLDRPVRLETATATDADFSVTCRWEPHEEEATPTEPDDGESEPDDGEPVTESDAET
jgi:hypothetical protein